MFRNIREVGCLKKFQKGKPYRSLQAVRIHFMVETLYLTSILSYTARSLYFVLGAARERAIVPHTAEYEPLVSIVVPARNEEQNIVRCIESIAAVDYPLSKLELIVVDDRSTDATSNILSFQQQRFSQLRVISIQEDGEKNLRGKAGALECGIRAARGEIILMTDADCVVSHEWVRSHIRVYADPSVGIVGAYTHIDGSGLFARLQAVEWTSTHTMASAAVHFKQYLGCYGNNLSVRRSAYDSVGGYAAIPFSVTEDLALLQAITEAGFHARYICSSESGVSTLALNTLAEYLSQHKRWAIGARKLGIRAFLFALSSAILWAGLVAAFIQHDWLWLMAIIGTRVLDDLAINAPVFRIFKREYLHLYTVPAVLFFSLLELVLPFMLMNGRTTWKGQTFKA